MQVRSPFTYIGDTKLGTIYRPYIVIRAYSKRKKGWQQIEMIIDSGADYTLFPKRFSEILGVDLKRDCEIENTKGIGGKEKVYQYKKLPLMIGTWKKEVPVGFLGRNDIPPLLGRLKCLEKLDLGFKNFVSIIS